MILVRIEASWVNPDEIEAVVAELCDPAIDPHDGSVLYFRSGTQVRTSLSPAMVVERFSEAYGPPGKEN